jgi:acetyl/propionyl-CoA carboxylase alpha subunit
MNTRLQVEHPVTELVTGRDLVADQLAIAAGDLLPTSQPEVDAALARGGHAIEVRLYAEDADAGFLPATGRIARLRWPNGPGIRVDAGIDEGAEISGRFDPMLAKVIAHGADRAEALARLRDGLDGTVVLGLTTNLRFLRWLVRRPEVVAGEARIDTLEHVWQPDEASEAMAIPEWAWAAGARSLAEDGPTGTWRGGWRLNAAPRIRIVSGDEERAVAVDGGAAAESDAADRADRPDPRGPAAPFETVRVDGTAHVDVDGRSVEFRIAPPPDVDRAARAAAAAHHGGGRVELVAPMPGAVLAVHVTEGAALEAGDPIVTLEAMKMEHVVAAPVAGTLDEVRVKPGEQVARGDLLAVVEP